MDIEFADSLAALIETEAAADTNLPVGVIQSARQRLNIMRAAPDARTLQNWKSLGMVTRVDSAEYVVELSQHWAMSFSIREINNVMTIIILSLEGFSKGRNYG